MVTRACQNITKKIKLPTFRMIGLKLHELFFSSLKKTYEQEITTSNTIYICDVIYVMPFFSNVKILQTLVQNKQISRNCSRFVCTEKTLDNTILKKCPNIYIVKNT